VRTSDAIDQLATALAKAQGAYLPAVKDSRNDHYKSKYLDLFGVWQSCRDALSKNGLCVIQAPSEKSASDGSTVTFACRIVHTSGQWIESELTIRPMKSDAHGIGSAITYARRYLLASMVGVAPEDEDDDGNAASAPAQRMVAPATKVGTAGVDPKAAFKAAVQKWSGVAVEDAAKACRDLCRVWNITDSKMTAADWAAATAEVCKKMDEGADFFQELK
jgi:hypothetical protein